MFYILNQFRLILHRYAPSPWFEISSLPPHLIQSDPLPVTCPISTRASLSTLTLPSSSTSLAIRAPRCALLGKGLGNGTTQRDSPGRIPSQTLSRWSGYLCIYLFIVFHSYSHIKASCVFSKYCIIADTYLLAVQICADAIALLRHWDSTAHRAVPRPFSPRVQHLQLRNGRWKRTVRFAKSPFFLMGKSTN